MLARGVVPHVYHTHNLIQLQLFGSMKLLIAMQMEIRFR